MPQTRHPSLDILRGFAVMGILLMNIIGFAMPMSAYANPAVWGGASGADFWAWAIASVLIDGKMRGLFSLLFGASMLLVISRAEANGLDAASVHFRRMGWLFLFGLLHFCLIWAGDILALYALCGAFAFMLKDANPKTLLWLGAGLILFNMLLWGMTALEFHEARFEAQAISASEAARARYAEIIAALGAPGDPGVRADVMLQLGRYSEIAAARFVDGSGGLIAQVFAYGPETVGLMAWGMALLKSGILTGQWPARRCLKAALAAYAIGLPLSAALVWAGAASGFDPLTMNDIYYVWSVVPRMAMMIGHLMLLLALIGTTSASRLARVGAAGRIAFSNYILTSVLMTTLFYGYGGGLYGALSRAQVYLVVPLVWALMLAWSKPWLDRYRYGPLEWVWRSLARWKWQPMRVSTD
ncbi:MAG: DUF418 domain-containing protein [Chakrabartia godavariana]